MYINGYIHIYQCVHIYIVGVSPAPPPSTWEVEATTQSNNI